MKIYSKFYDYYDSAGSMDFDDEIEFMRIRKFKSLLDIFPLKKEARIVKHFISKSYSCVKRTYTSSGMAASPCEPLKYGKENIHGIHYGVVGFCGKLYPFLVLEKSCVAYLEHPEEYEVVFDKKRIFSLIENRPRPVDHSYSIGLPDWFDRFANHSDLNERSREVVKLIQTIFDRTQSPIFQIKSTTDYCVPDFENAPELKALNFQRVVDPYTAYQEIRMYLASMARPEKVMVTISDKDKIQQHGFDKFSFKTMKGDKKPRSKNRGKNK